MMRARRRADKRAIAWTVAVVSCVFYVVALAHSLQTARAFAPVFVVLVLGAWVYLTVRQEKDHAEGRRRVDRRR